MRSNYNKIGPYIREVVEKNSSLSVELLLGVSVSKEFIPSIANIIGTDMSTYKIVHKDQFAYGPVTSRNSDKVSIALLDEDQCIVSTSYTVFEIIDAEVLLPEYLMMWFRRPEFDRYARFKSHGSVRELFDWEEMCDVELPIPSIEKQQEIVTEYHTIVDRITLNDRLNRKLEETAQAIYKQWFVDFEFPMPAEYAAAIGNPEMEGQPYKSSGGEMVFDNELKQNIPKGWIIQNVHEFCSEMKNGATPDRSEPEYWDSKDIPWLKSGEISNNIIVEAEEYISKNGYKNSSTKLLPKNTVLMALYGATAGQIGYLKFESSTNQACCAMICNTLDDAAFLYYYFLFNQDAIANMANGGAQENLSKKIVEELPVLVPAKGSHHRVPLNELISNREVVTRELVLLKETADIILSRMASLTE